MVIEPIAARRSQARHICIESARSRGLQHTITHIVTALIVDTLEVIQIDDDDAGRHTGGAERFDKLLDTVAIQNLGEQLSGSANVRSRCDSPERPSLYDSL